MMILMLAVAATSVTFGQTKMSNDSKVEAQIVALEKAGWEAWKNKDAAWFRTNQADEALSVHADGVTNKTQGINSLAACEVKSVSLDNFKFLMLDKNSALITFTGTQDAVCGGETQPPTVNASSVYAKRGGKWLNIFYTEVATAQTKMSGDMNNSSDGATEQAIIANERATWKTLTDGKFDDFASRLAENYQGFYSDKMTNKASEVADVKQIKFKRVDLSNFKVQMLDNASAIVMYEVASDVTAPDGRDVSSNSRVMTAYVKRGGKWLVAHHTNFKIEK